jgi:hypothetical protein
VRAKAWPGGQYGVKKRLSHNFNLLRALRDGLKARVMEGSPSISEL